MVMKSEHLPCEAEEILADGERRVKLVFATSHSIPKIGNLSLFQNSFPEPAKEEDPLPFVQPNDASNMMFETEPMEEMLASEYSEMAANMESEPAEESAETESDAPVEEQLYQLLEQLMDEKKAQQEDDTNRFVFRCDGIMSIRGSSIVIHYEEDESGGMEDTQSEIVLHGGRQDMVSIVRTGSVANTLVLEKGKRHISAYNTPIMPFQICVFAKECEQNVTFEKGGTIYMDYYVELRGTEMQHTKMRITVKPI